MENAALSPAPIIKPRSPKVASRLSDLCVGLGQIYCGHLVRGLLILLIGMVMLVAWIVLLVAMKGRFAEAALIGIVPLTALWLFARFDARRLAAAAPADYALKEYNRWYVYAMFILIVVPMAVCGAFFVRATAYEAFYIVTDRMSPTLRAGQYILVDKTIYDVRPMRRGDVVIVRSSNDLRTNLVQRLVALPEDKIDVSGGAIKVNGVAVSRPVSASSTQPTTQEAAKPVELTLAQGQGYFINDNPDSQLAGLGQAPLNNVVGRVAVIYWPRPARVK